MENKRKALGLIWRESVYKNNFKCACGNELADPENGSPKGYVLLDPDEGVIYCNKCFLPVCFTGEIETDLPGGLHGDINNYIKSQSS